MISRFPASRPPETVTQPTITGGGTIDSGGSGSITVSGSVSSWGSAVTYEVTSYTGISSISPTSGIANNGTISFTVNTVTASSTYSITVRARSATGGLSSTRMVSGTIKLEYQYEFNDMFGIEVIWKDGNFRVYINNNAIKIPYNSFNQVSISGKYTGNPTNRNAVIFTESTGMSRINTYLQTGDIVIIGEIRYAGDIASFPRNMYVKINGITVNSIVGAGNAQAGITVL